MLLLGILIQMAAVQAALEDCPMQALRSIILQVRRETRDPAVQKRVIRRIAEELHGGDWGVIIVRDPTLASRGKEVSWEFPYQNILDGTPGFCLTVIEGWLYHVVKVCGYGYSDKVNVEGLVNKIREQATLQSQPQPYAATKERSQSRKERYKPRRVSTLLVRRTIAGLMLLFVILINVVAVHAALEDCPMQSIRSIIQEVYKASRDPVIQKRVIRRIAEEVHGGDWGVIIVRDPALAIRDVNWEFPYQNNADNSPAFCLTKINGWLYHVIKVRGYGQSDRVNIEGLVKKVRQQVTNQRLQVRRKI
ncbi:unnamed protein product [Cylicocyclus nassatus]|uniref:Uncharacterized protein n=1 Tax=Cylicocyclus nassatus TaxID=53992 RepID=A0AA36DQX5_CYLNA|nr:unnamed protein product [Cylicocyclus nassatus]